MPDVPKPCKQCPYVLNRTQGFTGPYKPGELHTLAALDQRFPCHMAQSQEDPPRCRGIDLYRNQLCKRPRDPVEAQAQDATVRAHGATEKAVAPFGLDEYHSTLGLKSISKRRT